MELHIDAGAWASVKIIPRFENFSIFGVFRVFEMGAAFLSNEKPRYALVSPIPMSSAIKNKMFGLGDSAKMAKLETKKKLTQ